MRTRCCTTAAVNSEADVSSCAYVSFYSKVQCYEALTEAHRRAFVVGARFSDLGVDQFPTLPPNDHGSLLLCGQYRIFPVVFQPTNGHPMYRGPFDQPPRWNAHLGFEGFLWSELVSQMLEGALGSIVLAPK